MTATELDYRLADLPERIQSKIRVNPATGCWEWTGCINNNGYGKVRWGGKSLYSHRVVYTLLAAPIPAGLTLDHVQARGCRSTACCWPAHLEPVTQGENNRRCDTRWLTRARRTDTHCGNGHEYTPENIYIRSDSGSRQCRTCKKLVMRRSYARKRAGR